MYAACGRLLRGTRQEGNGAGKGRGTRCKNRGKDDIRDVSFVAVGDNLIHGAIFYYNAKGDGTYDFKDIYEHTNRYTRKADITYINQETIAAVRSWD